MLYIYYIYYKYIINVYMININKEINSLLAFGENEGEPS